MKRARAIAFVLAIVVTGCGGGKTGCGGGGPTMSCPFVYLGQPDGSYAYYTDLAGSVLGKGIALFAPEHYGDGGLYELGDFAADASGSYRLKIRETIWEADYFDRAELVVVDVPAGHRALSSWSFTSQLGRPSGKDLVTVRDPRPPLTAVDDASGNDVLDALSRIDEVPVPVTEQTKTQVVVDFGPVQRPERAKLVLTAWSHYADLSETQRPPYSAGTVIETKDAAGRWQVRKVAGKNPGDRRTWVIDIANIPTREGSLMRITMAHQPIGLDVLDRLLLDDSEPVPTRITRLAPAVAELRHGGSTGYVPSTLFNRIHAEDERNPPVRAAMMSGRYTRFGDVRPLLAATDDRFVVMAHGDELLLRFDEPPASPEDADRWVFLDANVLYTIKHSVYGPLTKTIDPVPFSGMKTYPYPSESNPYRDDPDYARYLDTWNTRSVE